jgi:hypothetical protein
MVKNLVGLLVIAFLALASVGCCDPQRYKVTIELDPDMKQRLADLNRDMVVDIVAIPPGEYQRWEDYPMTKYFTPPYELRNSVKDEVVTLTFNANNTSKSIAENDPVWNKWLAGANSKSPPHLYILAQLPGTTEDLQGDKDPRRQILPLGSCRWDGAKEIKVLVQRDRIKTTTGYKPDKK